MNEFFLDQTDEQRDLLVESPMDRYECCAHCRSPRCIRHDGHPEPCPVQPCEAGRKMLGES